MKNTYTVVFLILLFIPAIYGQKSIKTKNLKQYSVSLESPLFFKDFTGYKGNTG